MIDTAFVPSQTDPATVYRVERLGRVLVCPCRGYQMRKTCSHVKTAAEILASRPLVRDAADAVRALSLRLTGIADGLDGRQMNIDQARALWERIGEIETEVNSLAGWIGKRR